MSNAGPTFCFAALFFILALSQPAFSAPADEIRDATGTVVRFVPRPKRVVTLIPSLGELVADILGDEIDRIVAVSEGTDYPPALKKKRQIGPYNHFSVETVAALKPDLVLASKDGNPKDSVLHLRELGLPVFVVETGDFDQVVASMKQVGRLLGAPERGEKIAAQFQAGLQHFRERALKRNPAQKLSVLIQLGDQPLVVAGSGTFLHDALTLIGAINPYADAKNHYPRPSVEDVLVKDPDLILICVLGDNPRPFEAMARQWMAFKSLRAVKNRKVILMNSNPLLRPTLRLLEGISLLERKVYPDGK